MNKPVLIIILIFVALGFFYFFIYKANTIKAEPTMFLIPEGYDGLITVAFGHPDGQKETFKNKKRVIKIINPKKIFLSKFTEPDGILDVSGYSFYAYDKAGERELKRAVHIDLKDKNTMGIFNGAAGKTTIEGVEVPTYRFFVTSRKGIKEHLQDR